MLQLYVLPLCEYARDVSESMSAFTVHTDIIAHKTLLVSSCTVSTGPLTFPSGPAQMLSKR